MPDDLLGQTLGQYQLRALLGKGGMSTVYLAYQPAMDRMVAVKVLPREFLHDDTFLMRFQQEARTIARLEHLHILPVYDVGQDKGIPYLVTRYLAGGTLADLLNNDLPQMPVVIRIVEQVADALDYAHERGIIHRDLKPSNILLDDSGNAYLSDFGIARVAQAQADLTGSRVLGTPPYIAPEMVQKDQPVTASVDIYALGVITYEMLTGEPPYFDEDPMRVLMAHVLEPVPSVRNIDPNIPPAVDAVVQRCLAKKPADRYPTAGAFAREFARAAQTPQAIPSQPPPPAAMPPIAAPPASYDQRPSLPPAPAYPAYPPPEAEHPRRRPSGCLIALGVAAGLIAVGAGIVLAVTGGELNALLPPTRTPQPTVTPTPSTGAAGVLTPGVATPAVESDRLAFASTRDGDYEIYAVNRDGSDLQQLTFNEGIYDYSPNWSPDGAQIAYVSTADGDAEIMIMNADGSGIRAITDNNSKDVDPDWSPDGEWITFSSNRDGDFELYIMRPDGSGLRQLTFNDLNDRRPRWSPDGSQIGYYAQVGDNTASSELFLINAAGGVPVRLTDNAVADLWPSWSPDGTQLVYTSALDVPEGNRALWVMELASRTATRLTDGLWHDDDPAWSPGGRYIAFDTDRNGNGYFALYVLDLVSMELEALPFEAASDVAPAWRP
jgi:Tol biopolymer transport system component/tRNA A-37 threonylcarbamoyl transferase component Bud32